METSKNITGQKRFGPRARKPAFRRSRREIKNILEAAFRSEFPKDTVDVSDGYKDNIHVIVVSRRFDSIPEKNKQDLMWDIIDGTELTDKEKSLVSLVYPVSPSEMP